MLRDGAFSASKHEGSGPITWPHPEELATAGVSNDEAAYANFPKAKAALAGRPFRSHRAASLRRRQGRRGFGGFRALLDDEIVAPEAMPRNFAIAAPVPAGMRRPTMTFSLRPSSVSILPLTAASVSTRVVSWKEAAEMNERVCSDALVMPSSTGVPDAGLPPFSIALALASSSST